MRLSLLALVASITHWHGQADDAKLREALACQGKSEGNACHFAWYYNSQEEINGNCTLGNVSTVALTAACRASSPLPPPPPPPPPPEDSSGMSWEDIATPCVHSPLGAACQMKLTMKNGTNGTQNVAINVHGACKGGSLGQRSTQACLRNGGYDRYKYRKAASTSSCTITCESLGLVQGGRPTPWAFKFDYEQYTKTGNPYKWSPLLTMLDLPTSSVTCTQQHEVLIITSNAIPNHDSCTVGAPPRNLQNPEVPIPVHPQAFTWTIPCRPTVAAKPSSLPQGVIGFARNGVPFHNPINVAGHDITQITSKGSYEAVDKCFGSSSDKGAYHYNMQWKEEGCLLNTNAETLIGFALDGFPIYSAYTYSSPALDACGGYSHPIHGYRYHIRNGKPYTIGCFSGTLASPSVLDGSSQRCVDCSTTVVPIQDTCPVSKSQGLTTIVCAGHGTCDLASKICQCDNDPLEGLYIGHACEDNVNTAKFKTSLQVSGDRSTAQALASQHAHTFQTKCTGVKVSNVSTVSHGTSPYTVLCPNTALVAVNKSLTCAKSARECVLEPNRTELQSMKDICETGNSTFCGLVCATDRLRCSDILPPLASCGMGQFRCISGECAPNETACAFSSSICAPDEVPCGDGLTCAKTAFRCAQKVAYMGCPVSTFQCDSSDRPSCGADNCTAVAKCQTDEKVCGSKRTSNGHGILKRINDVWQLEPLCIPQHWTNCTSEAMPQSTAVEYNAAALLASKTILATTTDSRQFVSITIPAQAMVNPNPSVNIKIVLKSLPSSALNQGAFSKQVHQNAIMSTPFTIMPSHLVTIKKRLLFDLAVDIPPVPSFNLSHNSAPTKMTLDETCKVLLADLSVYFAVDVMDGTTAVKIAGCSKGSLGDCSCSFSSTQYGSFALVDDHSTLDTSPAPVPPPIVDEYFLFKAQSNIAVPVWHWQAPTTEVPTSVVPVVHTIRKDVWDKIPSEVKLAVLVLGSCSLVGYVLYRSWQYKVEQPLHPRSGQKIELGEEGAENENTPWWLRNSLGRKIYQRYYKWNHAEELERSAQEELQRQHEVRRLAEIKHAESEARKTIKNRSRPLVRSGPAPVGSAETETSFMLEMYKPVDAKRVYEK